MISCFAKLQPNLSRPQTGAHVPAVDRIHTRRYTRCLPAALLLAAFTGPVLAEDVDAAAEDTGVKILTGAGLQATDNLFATSTGQVSDVIAGAGEIVAAGGQLVREPQPEDNEPPHLAMCVDTEGNEIMLTRRRVH